MSFSDMASLLLFPLIASDVPGTEAALRARREAASCKRLRNSRTTMHELFAGGLPCARDVCSRAEHPDRAVRDRSARRAAAGLRGGPSGLTLSHRPEGRFHDSTKGALDESHLSLGGCR